MNFIKKRVFLISCLAVVVLGLGAFAWGVWKTSSNKKELESLAQRCKSVDSLSNQIIPENVLEQMKKNAELANNDKKDVLNLAKETTSRILLSKNVFPQPRGENTRVFYREFGDRYVSFLERLLAEVNAGDKPSEVEENKTRQEYEQNVKNDAGGGDMGMLGRGTGPTQVENLLGNFRRERANSIGLYANFYSFCAYDYWRNWNSGDRNIMLEDSWYTQVAAWIQEDVILSIKEVNGQSQSVPTSPVKRLMEIAFNGKEVKSETTAAGAAAQGTAAGNVLPGYVLRTGSGSSGSSSGGGGTTLTGTITEPWTGQASNDLIDVVQFRVAVVIDSAYIQDFMSALQSKKFSLDPDTGQMRNLRDQITILQMHMAPLDLDAEMQEGYYYGSGAISLLRLVCEYYFFKSGYQDWMPEPVQAVFEESSKEKSNIND